MNPEKYDEESWYIHNRDIIFDRDDFPTSREDTIKFQEMYERGELDANTQEV
jgi:hypothetical protein